MVTVVKKRDGRVEKFNEEKIISAILKAANSVGGNDKEIAQQVADAVVHELDEKYDGETPSIEAVQDIIERNLIHLGHARTAKAFILYRAERTRSRDKKSQLMKTLRDLTMKSRDDVDLKRENGNIDGDCTMGIMLRYGSEASKQFSLTEILSPVYSEAHINGDFHIHDLDFYPLCMNCCQIPAGKLLDQGFNTGHGYLRTPSNIQSAGSLACIIIQSNQNDMFGGQSIPKFDYDLAPYVAKTFVKRLIDVIDDAYLVNGIEITAGTIQQIKDACQSHLKRYKTLIDTNLWHMPSSNDNLITSIESIVPTSISVKTCFKQALKRTEKDTYQAMEAVVHNLNTMHCLPANERLWVYDTKAEKLRLVSIAALKKHFKSGRFKAISLNPETLQTEFKTITHVTRKDSNRRLITLMTKSGQQVTTTDNHRVLTLVGRELRNKYPEKIKSTITPRGFNLPVISNEISVKKFGEIYKTSPYKKDSVHISAALAELLGYYVADGSVIANDSTVVFTTVNKVNPDHLSDLFTDAFGQEFTYTDINYTTSEGVVSHKERRFNVGVRLARCFKYMCGSNSYKKKIPQSILLNEDDNIKRVFLNAYLSCDGSVRKYLVASSVSKTLIRQIGLLCLSLGELPYYAKTGKLYTISIGGYAAQRMGLSVTQDSTCEIPKYDLSTLVDVLREGYGLTWSNIPRRKSNAIRYHEVESICADNSIDVSKDSNFDLLNVFRVHVEDREESNSGDTYVYDLGVEDNENFLTEDGIFVHNSRAGAQVPFSSLNYGTDTSAEGRMVIKNILLALDAGMGDGETPIFPIHIFKVKDGINGKPGDPNYDLFQLSIKVSAKRLFPNWVFLDAPFNLKYYKPGNPDTEAATMGCRTRVVGNVYDPSREIFPSRGNLSFISLNLPRLGIKHMKDRDLDGFFADLKEKVNLMFGCLLERFEVQAKRQAKNFPFLMGQGVWLDSENLDPEDEVREVIKHGTLSIGFIGLAECLKALIGKHHGESAEAQKLGLKIVGLMRQMCDEKSKETGLNFSLIGSPAEGLSGRFVRMDRKQYGELEGITDRDYYTNSNHIPVYYPISVFDKIKLEAPYHELENAGHIAYVEVDGDPTNNLEAMEDIVQYMKVAGIGYGSINHPVDRDPVCGYTGIIGDVCPRCGRRDGEAISVELLRRIKKNITRDMRSLEEVAQRADAVPNAIL